MGHTQALSPEKLPSPFYHQKYVFNDGDSASCFTRIPSGVISAWIAGMQAGISTSLITSYLDLVFCWHASIQRSRMIFAKRFRESVHNHPHSFACLQRVGMPRDCSFNRAPSVGSAEAPFKWPDPAECVGSNQSLI